jgi:DNA repair protein RadC
MPHNMDFTLKVTEVELIYRNRLKLSERPHINGSLSAWEIFLENWDMNKIELQEQFSIMLLDNKNSCLGISNIAKGGITACALPLPPH